MGPAADLSRHLWPLPFLRCDQRMSAEEVGELIEVAAYRIPAERR